MGNNTAMAESRVVAEFVFGKYLGNNEFRLGKQRVLPAGQGRDGREAAAVRSLQTLKPLVSLILIKKVV